MLSFVSRVGQRFVSAVRRHRAAKRTVAILAEFKGNTWTLQGLCVLEITSGVCEHHLHVSPYSIADHAQALHLPHFDEQFTVAIDNCTTFSKIQNRLVICQAFRSGFVDYGFFFFQDSDCQKFWQRVQRAEDYYDGENPRWFLQINTPEPFTFPLQCVPLVNVHPHEARSYCLMSSSLNKQYTPENESTRLGRLGASSGNRESRPTHTSCATAASGANSLTCRQTASPQSSRSRSSSRLSGCQDTCTSNSLATRNRGTSASSNDACPPAAQRTLASRPINTPFLSPSGGGASARSGPPPLVRALHRPIGGSPLAEPLTVSAALRFPSVRGDVCVTKGKWYYEVELRSDELMQVGFVCVDLFFPKVRGFGVGDDGYSWSYDGYRQLRWGADAKTNSHPAHPLPYGDGHRQWRRGDRVGVSVELTKKHQSMEFFINGTSLGVAFENFSVTRRGLSPAVSLSDNQSFTFVFEKEFLKHLPQGYSAFQDCRGELRKCLLANSDVSPDVASIILDFVPI